MTLAFDSLGYARRLVDAGLPREQADAIASAARDFLVSPEVATKADLAALKAELVALVAGRPARAGSAELTHKLTLRLGGTPSTRWAASDAVAGIAIVGALVRLP